MTSILVTGASGFIGSEIALALSSNFLVRQVFRTFPIIKPLSDYVICDFSDSSSLSSALKNIDVVIHCAGRAHVLADKYKYPIDEFRRINVDMTMKLAREAVNSGVKRFVFLSSIGVNGNVSLKPFKETDPPSPEQDYAISKLEAEQGLQEIAHSSDMEVVIIRPPLVYAGNAPGNFRLLMKWMDRNIPLPFGAVKNKRSFIAIGNLIDFIVTCTEHPAAANEVFLVSDDHDLSTTEFLSRISFFLKKKPLLFSLNQKLFKFLLISFGKKSLSQQLLESLQIDISKAKKILNWVPPISVDDGLKSAAESFKKDVLK